MKCLHMFRTGLGIYPMADAVECVRCGYTRYPEYLDAWAKFCLYRLKRVVKQDAQPPRQTSDVANEES